MELSANQAAERINVTKARLRTLIKSGRLVPVNAPRPGAKKFFARFSIKACDELRRELRANGAATHSAPRRERDEPAPADRLTRIEQKLDQLLKMWA